MSTRWLQDNMFGPPEDPNHCEGGELRDDAPLACERENYWPIELAALLGPETLERLYGDIPRRTRLTVPEICRRLRRGHTHVYDLIEAGSLDATDDRHPDALRPSYTIYRYSLVMFLFLREFVQQNTRCNLPAEDMQRVERAVDAMRRRRSKEFRRDVP